MIKKKFTEALAAIAVFMLSFFNIFTIIFLIFSLVCFSISKEEREKWKHLEENGVLVEATITDIVQIPDADDYDYEVYFSYEYDGREYTFMVYNYSEGRTLGNTVEAYIDPDIPEELVVYNGGTFCFFFLSFLILAIFSSIVKLVLIFTKRGPKNNG